VITLKCEKSRYGHSAPIEYHYDEGKMVRSRPTNSIVSQITKQLQDLLKGHPGILAGEFDDLAKEHKLPRKVARAFLRLGIGDQSIRVEAKGRGREHFWAGGDSKRDNS
jgi:hypothetical protein